LFETSIPCFNHQILFLAQFGARSVSSKGQITIFQ
jgi:hypothetical protein